MSTKDYSYIFLRLARIFINFSQTSQKLSMIQISINQRLINKLWCSFTNTKLLSNEKEQAIDHAVSRVNIKKVLLRKRSQNEEYTLYDPIYVHL